jgi:hypothetical protein
VAQGRRSRGYFVNYRWTAVTRIYARGENMMIGLLACVVVLAANGVSDAVDTDSTPPTKRETAATLIRDRLQRLADAPDGNTNVAALKGLQVRL